MAFLNLSVHDADSMSRCLNIFQEAGDYLFLRLAKKTCVI